MREVERGGRWGCERMCILVGCKEGVGYARANFVEISLCDHWWKEALKGNPTSK